VGEGVWGVILFYGSGFLAGTEDVEQDEGKKGGHLKKRGSGREKA